MWQKAHAHQWLEALLHKGDRLHIRWRNTRERSDGTLSYLLQIELPRMTLGEINISWLVASVLRSEQTERKETIHTSESLEFEKSVVSNVGPDVLVAELAFTLYRDRNALSYEIVSYR